MADSGPAPAASGAATAGLTDREVEQRLTALDGLLARIERADGDVAQAAREAVAALAEVYGAALLRLAGLAGETGRGAAAMREDRLIRHLLALHGGAPDPQDESSRASSGCETGSCGTGSCGAGTCGCGATHAPPAARRSESALIPAESLLRRPSPHGRLAPAEAARPHRRGDGPDDRCELCGQPAPAGHRHVLDVGSREALCACRSCSILFDRGGGDARYRLIPERRQRLPELSPADLGVPVGLAFFVRRAGGSVMAHYPSPAGATQWEIDPDRWRAAVARCPQLEDLAEDVEAVLVNTARGRTEAWLTPIDDCYRLVAAVRANWVGISGGDRVWPRVERFFAELASAS